MSLHKDNRQLLAGPAHVEGSAHRDDLLATGPHYEQASGIASNLETRLSFLNSHEPHTGAETHLHSRIGVQYQV